MGRGLVHGATVLAFTGLMGALFCAIAPMWFAVRLEQGEKQCWQGEGIFTSRYFWGSTLYGPACADPLHLGPLSTHAAYCDARVPLVNKHESRSYNADMCTATRHAKWTSVLAIVASAGCVGMGLFMSFAKRFRERNERVLSIIAASCSFAALLFSVTSALIMFASPLFSRQHIKALSHDQVGPDYTGFSCSFQTPMHNLLSLLLPGAEKCVLVGPAVLVFFVHIIANALALSLLLMLVRFSVAPPASATAYRPRRASQDATLFEPRQYSLYGAASRKFGHHSRPVRFVLITLVPFSFVISNAFTWSAYLLLGIQVLTKITVSILPNDAPQVHNAVLMSNASLPGFALLRLQQDLRVVADRQGLGALLPEGQLYWDMLNIFNFSPMTSVTYFWTSGARLIAAASFLSIFVVPISKVIVWVWFFYAPAGEVWRGRVLTFVDFTGKFILANLFILQFMGVALTFTRDIVIPGALLGPGLLLPPQHALVVEIRAGLGSGTGSWMYVVTSVASLFIGQSMVIGHNLATVWEEERRAVRATSLSNLTTPSAQIEDTPMMLPPLAAESSSRQPLLQPNRRSVLDALASFGSTADLQRLATRQSSATNFEPQNALLRSMGPSFGTRFFSIPEHGTTGDFVSMSRGPKLAPPLHPSVEAMCDRVHSPMQGLTLRWTPFGKTLIWLLLFIYAGFLLVCQSWELFEIHQTGIVGDVLVSSRSKYRSYSLVGLVSTMDSISIGSSPELGILFFIFTALMPVVVAFALFLLWTIEMTLWQQVVFFSWLEVTTAWSSLDIFFLSCVIMRIELEQASRSLVSDAVPKLRDLEHMLLPHEKGILTAEMRLLPGFWILALTVLFEKIAVFMLMEQAVCAISERRAELLLREFAENLPSGEAAEGEGVGEVELHAALSPASGDHIVEDAAEGLLEADAGAVFPSAARYFSSYFPRHIYAGLPRWMWGSWHVKMGLMADANLVKRYHETGSWEAARMQPPPQHVRSHTSSRSSLGTDGAAGGLGGDDGPLSF